MSKVISQKVQVFGYLETAMGTFPMLKQFPNRYDVPSTLRDVGFLSVYVMDKDSFAKNIYVNGNLIIRPVVEDTYLDVKFLIEDVDKVAVEGDK